MYEKEKENSNANLREKFSKDPIEELANRLDAIESQQLKPTEEKGLKAPSSANMLRRMQREERSQIRRKKRMQRNIIRIVIIAVIAIAILAVVLFKTGIIGTKADTIPANADNQTGEEQTVEAMAQNEEKNTEMQVDTDYDQYKYYKKENEDRYTNYHKQNSQMPSEQVVWKVNAYLDYPFYQNDVQLTEKELDSQYVIVNKYYKVPEDYKPEDLVEISEGVLVRKMAKDAYEKMQTAAQEAGMNIKAVSGFRTVEYQRNLYNRYLSSDKPANVDRYSSRGGYSEHHTGLAIDVVGSFGSLTDFEDTKESPWIYENAHKYGFIVRYNTDNESVTGYKNEPWHLRYIGEKAATDMKEKGVGSFEEYKEKYL